VPRGGTIGRLWCLVLLTGLLLAPSVPLIMYAIIARVPIKEMFLAGLLPAALMVGFLLLHGGVLRSSD